MQFHMLVKLFMLCFGLNTIRRDSPGSRPHRGEFNSVTRLNLKKVRDSVVRAIVVDQVPLVLDTDVTFAKLQGRFGKTVLRRPLNESGVWRLCYRIADRAGPILIQFESDDIGGPDHDLMGFTINRLRHQAKSSSVCPVIHSVKIVKTDNGLYIGMPIADLLKVMGHPKKTGHGSYDFEYSRTVETRNDTTLSVPYDVDATLHVETQNARVTVLQAWYSETT